MVATLFLYSWVVVYSRQFLHTVFLFPPNCYHYYGPCGAYEVDYYSASDIFVNILFILITFLVVYLIFCLIALISRVIIQILRQWYPRVRR